MQPTKPPCSHDARIYLYQPQDDAEHAIVWCRTCGAYGKSAADKLGYHWTRCTQDPWSPSMRTTEPTPTLTRGQKQAQTKSYKRADDRLQHVFNSVRAICERSEYNPDFDEDLEHYAGLRDYGDMVALRQYDEVAFMRACTMAFRALTGPA